LPKSHFKERTSWYNLQPRCSQGTFYEILCHLLFSQWELVPSQRARVYYSYCTPETFIWLQLSPKLGKRLSWHVHTFRGGFLSGQRPYGIFLIRLQVKLYANHVQSNWKTGLSSQLRKSGFSRPCRVLSFNIQSVKGIHKDKCAHTPRVCMTLGKANLLNLCTLLQPLSQLNPL